MSVRPAAVSLAKFRESFAERIEDPVSTEPMKKAFTIFPCGHVLNEDTLIQCLARDKLCPLDKQPIERHAPNYNIRQLAEMGDLLDLAKDVESNEEARGCFVRAEELSKQGHYTGAVELLLRTIELCPNYEKAQAFLEFCLESSSKQVSLPASSPKEQYIGLLLKLLENQQIKDCINLHQLLNRQVEELIQQEDLELTPAQKVNFNWSQRLLLDQKVSQVVADKLLQIQSAPDASPSSQTVIVPAVQPFKAAEATSKRKSAGSPPPSYDAEKIAKMSCCATFKGHKTMVTVVVLLTDNLIASADYEGEIKIWEISTQKCLRTMQGYQWGIWSLVRLDDNTIVSGNGDGSMTSWDVSSGKKLVTRKEHTGWVWCHALFDDGLFATSEDQNGVIKFWDRSLTCLKTLHLDSLGIHSVIRFPNGNFACRSPEGGLTVWDRTTGKALKRFPYNPSVYDAYDGALARLPNGLVVCGGEARRRGHGILLYDLSKDKIECLGFLEDRHRELDQGVNFLTPFGANLFAAGYGDGTVNIWDPSQRKCIKTFHLENNIMALVSHVDGLFAAVGDNIELLASSIPGLVPPSEETSCLEHSSVLVPLTTSQKSAATEEQKNLPLPSAPPLDPVERDSMVLSPICLKSFPIFAVILKDDEEGVKACIKNKESVNVEDAMGNNPLFYAKTNGIIEILLRAGAVVKCQPLRSKESLQSLNDPVSKSDLVRTKQLLESGLADIQEVITPNVRSKGSCSVLHLATFHRSPMMVLLLIRAGANIEATVSISDLRGRSHPITPLQYSLNFTFFNDEIVAILLQAGANINTVGPGQGLISQLSAGEIAFIEAARRCQPSTIKLFLQRGASVNVSDSKGVTPLHNVTTLEVAKILVAAGANIHAQCFLEGKMTPLDVMTSPGKLPIMHYLIGCGARFSNADPLYSAVQNGSLQVIEALLGYGVDVNGDKSFRKKQTPLGYACEIGDCRADVVDCLLKNKAAVNIPDENGTTPLLQACMSSAFKVIPLLLAQGANPETPNKEGVSPMSYARKHNQILWGTLRNSSPQQQKAPVQSAAVEDSLATRFFSAVKSVFAPSAPPEKEEFIKPGKIIPITVTVKFRDQTFLARITPTYNDKEGHPTSNMREMVTQKKKLYGDMFREMMMKHEEDYTEGLGQIQGMDGEGLIFEKGILRHGEKTTKLYAQFVESLHKSV
jgi:ankyrin repeat protein/WD40 repeat protein